MSGGRIEETGDNVSTDTTRRRSSASAPARARASAPRTTVPPGEPLHQLLAAMHSVRDGDFDVHVPQHWPGIEGKLAEAFDAIVAANRRMAAELARVGQKVGREGHTRQR